MARRSSRPKRAPAHSAANRIHHRQPQSLWSATADHPWSRDLRIGGRYCARNRGVLRGGQGEKTNTGCRRRDEEDQRSRQPGKCFACAVLNTRREEGSSLGLPFSSIAVESGKSRGL